MRIKVNGIEMNYELSGKQDGDVVVLGHSLACGLVMWEPQMDELNRRFRVLRYDTRGHGGTEASPSPYTLDQLGEDAVALMNALDIDLVHWVGLSMGGMIGQCVALNYPGRLKTLSLCDTAARLPGDSDPVWQERIDLALKQGMGPLVQSTLERWFTPPFLAASPPMVETIREQILATPVDGYVGCSRAIMGLDYLDRLSQIKAPTLVMVGEDDPGTPVEASRAMHDRIPDSRLVILPSAAHLSNIEQREAFNSALMEFLCP
ncbi:MAG: 3-oxoadipate enol-lactonase [Deltaproteobacteria bacterium]|nr:3-oxoadipate enol-lactonase [Deltaproteobacteria bacterium]MBW2049925.1 3-oxoadipate enol-lactonase [Deltaproteobacteria bacterium]MBW2353865.1 3-oxoadipate enol-lactonase [Deltaproteobacteria bacterium]HDZ89699.1 3-oxoadipate enol-lactonase [Deltaproteobacteria bacterium]